MPTPRKQANILQRIEAHAANEWRDDNCWFSTYRPKRNGYVYIRPNGGGDSKQSIHRMAYEAHYAEPIPEGMVVMHTCDNPGCFNPNHLVIGTQSDNVQDCMSKGRHKGGRPKKQPLAP